MGITYEITADDGRSRRRCPNWFAVQDEVRYLWRLHGQAGWKTDGSPRGWYLEAVDADTGERHVIELTLQSGGRVQNGKFWRFVQGHSSVPFGDDDPAIIAIPANEIPQPTQHAVFADLDGWKFRLAEGFMTRRHAEKWAAALEIKHEIREVQA